MILLWGSPSDAPIVAVRDALKRMGIGHVLLDCDAVDQSSIEWSVGAQFSGWLRMPDFALDLTRITACYLRPDSRFRSDIADATASDREAQAHAIQVEDCLLGWSELTEALVLNRPSAMASNGSKPYQLLRVAEAGFRIPETLVTTDPDAARAFWREHGQVIYKSVSGIRSIVSRLTENHQDRLDDVQTCPTQFQNYVAGTDIRVHVVGCHVFACEILSQADDYRYAARSGQDVVLRPCVLPDPVIQRCHALTQALNLPLAGIDLRLGDDGAWYCFEVNPTPGFTFYQDQTGQPIAEAIAACLAQPGL